VTFARVFATELIKLRRSPITWLSWLAFSMLPVVAGLFAWIVKEPGRATELGLLGKKAQFAGLTADFASYFALLLQATGLAGMILVSVLAAYVFGREYADGTAKNQLTLPVGRHWFVISKFALVLLWFAVLTVSLIAEGFVVCRLLELPGFSPELALAGSRDILLAALVAWLLVPVVAWIATLGRGYLAPLGFTIFMLVLGNVIGATGWGKWFPWSIVPLFAGAGGPRVETLAPESLLIVVLTSACGIAATLRQVRLADNTQ
jgi:ABC-type transport system involved in multi-copper enzyme maturation permease subunit